MKQSIAVVGAGGRAGRAVVAEAARRGHRVTAVVRRPTDHTDLATQADVVAADATDAVGLEKVIAGHDAIVAALYSQDREPKAFYSSVARSLLDAADAAAVDRLVWVGLVATLEVTPAVRVMDAPDFPTDFRDFAHGHAAALDVFRTGTVDWVAVVPPMVLDQEAPITGTYRSSDSFIGDSGPLSYADLAVAVVDQVERRDHHRTILAVGASDG